VGEHASERERRALGLGEVSSEGVVELQLAFVAQRHDRGGGEGLRDRADPVLRCRCRSSARSNLREAEELLPYELAARAGGGAQARKAQLRLALPEQPGKSVRR
jgi:hypothetical protein